jgi:hypothetical protein
MRLADLAINQADRSRRMPPHGNAISHSNLQMRHRVIHITDVLTIIG